MLVLAVQYPFGARSMMTEHDETKTDSVKIGNKHVAERSLLEKACCRNVQNSQNTPFTADLCLLLTREGDDKGDQMVLTSP
jgi:hypothetical protein